VHHNLRRHATLRAKAVKRKATSSGLSSGWRARSLAISGISHEPLMRGAMSRNERRTKGHEPTRAAARTKMLEPQLEALCPVEFHPAWAPGQMLRARARSLEND
jgi:hypothetical protein